jgi:putative lipoic acid-binding regulatory protein
VILDDNCKTKPEIKYPCEWGYKIIGVDKIKLEACISEVIRERDYTIRAGNSSSGGKFHSLNVKCRVVSQEDRDLIFKAFQEHIDVKMVI